MMSPNARSSQISSDSAVNWLVEKIKPWTDSIDSFLILGSGSCPSVKAFNKQFPESSIFCIDPIYATDTQVSFVITKDALKNTDGLERKKKESAPDAKVSMHGESALQFLQTKGSDPSMMPYLNNALVVIEHPPANGPIKLSTTEAPKISYNGILETWEMMCTAYALNKRTPYSLLKQTREISF